MKNEYPYSCGNFWAEPKQFFLLSGSSYSVIFSKNKFKMPVIPLWAKSVQARSLTRSCFRAKIIWFSTVFTDILSFAAISR